MLAKVLTGELTFTSLRPCDLSDCTKSEIKAYFENSYNLNESLFTALKDDSVFYKCPDQLRLPLIFYFGHTACVYINKLILAGLVKHEDRVNLGFETIFETGVDEMSWDDTENYRMGGKYNWPDLDDVIEYRRKVRAIIIDVIDKTALELPVTMESPWWGLFMGMEHERIHLETSSVLIRQLPADLVRCPPAWKYAPFTSEASVGENNLIKMQETDIVLGKPVDFPSYGWDNEYGEVKCKVPAFEASKYVISNREFMEFVLHGGYEDETLWTAEGWKWREYRQARHPTFWVCHKGCKSGCGADLASRSHCKPLTHLTNGQNGYCNGHAECDGNGHQGSDEGGGCHYRLRVMFDVVDMPWDWPVEVNYHEAKAYCKYRGPDFRLPSEAEHNVIRGDQKPVNEGVSSDIIFQKKIPANVNLVHGSCTPVNLYPANEAGFYDVFGNVWEWMEDHFNGLPGFQTSHIYDDFSSPCFDGRHNCILGGSWVSTGDEASRFARFAFRRHFFQHCGFRIVRNASEESNTLVASPIRLIKSNVNVLDDGAINDEVLLDTSKMFVESLPSTNCQYLWETEEKLEQMLLAEFSMSQPWMAGVAQKCGEWVKEYQVNTGRALHMGCGTGRASVELSQCFDEVFAQDYCARFIEMCELMKKGESVMLSGQDGAPIEARFPKQARLDNIIFKQMTWLPNEVGVFDFILTTFFDRVQNVKSWTVRMPDILQKNGVAVIASQGIYCKTNLELLLAGRLEFLEELTLANQEGDDIYITVWRKI